MKILLGVSTKIIEKKLFQWFAQISLKLRSAYVSEDSEKMGKIFLQKKIEKDASLNEDSILICI